MRDLKAVLGAVALTFAFAAPVIAQPYPGTTAPSAAITQTGPSLAVGQETTIVSGGFAPGPVSVSVNGQGGAPDTADVTGVARTTVAVLGETLVRVEGVQFASHCGRNTVSVVGPAATGNSRTVNTLWDLACVAADSLPRTGVSILRWSLAGVAVLAVGSLMVVSNRRRRSS